MSTPIGTLPILNVKDQELVVHVADGKLFVSTGGDMLLVYDQDTSIIARGLSRSLRARVASFVKSFFIHW